jgi:diadenosine tetraphosphatase ApaH/serine/threonine PP2A family protein phosphatase
MRTGYLLGDGELEEIHSAGNLEHKRRTPLAAIRYHCLNCCGGSLHPWRLADGSIDGPRLPYDEVRHCPTTHCELWPFRSGRNPYTRNRGNPEGLRKARSVLSATAAKAPESSPDGARG